MHGLLLGVVIIIANQRSMYYYSQLFETVCGVSVSSCFYWTLSHFWNSKFPPVPYLNIHDINCIIWLTLQNILELFFNSHYNKITFPPLPLLLADIALKPQSYQKTDFKSLMCTIIIKKLIALFGRNIYKGAFLREDPHQDFWSVAFLWGNPFSDWLSDRTTLSN